MTPRALFAAAALAAIAASPVRAQEGGGTAPAAPARHVNKVTDAARAAFDRMGKAMYSAVNAGLKDLTGTMEMKMEAAAEGSRRAGMPAMSLAYAVTFKAPGDLKVEARGDAGGPAGMGMMSDGMKKEPVGTPKGRKPLDT